MLTFSHTRTGLRTFLLLIAATAISACSTQQEKLLHADQIALSQISIISLQAPGFQITPGQSCYLLPADSLREATRLHFEAAMEQQGFNAAFTPNKTRCLIKIELSQKENDAEGNSLNPDTGDSEYQKGRMTMTVANKATRKIRWRGAAEFLFDPESEAAQQQAQINHALSKLIRAMKKDGISAEK